MSGTNKPFEAEFEAARHQLSRGLESCRTVIESYRAMLTGQRDSDTAEPLPPENDNHE